MSVNQALDSASSQVYGQSFRDSPLRTGFTAHWWDPVNPLEDDDCTMAVYGNGNIKLKNYVPPSHSVAVRYLTGSTTGDINTSYQFSASAADSQDHMVRYTFDWGDGSAQTWTNWSPSYSTVVASHSWGSSGIYNVRVRAQCQSGTNSSWSTTHAIYIGDFYWLSVDAEDNYGMQLGASVWVDDVWVGMTPVSVMVPEGWRRVEVDYDLGYWYLVELSDGYGNGESRPIYSHTGITAYYQAIW